MQLLVLDTHFIFDLANLLLDYLRSLLDLEVGDL